MFMDTAELWESDSMKVVTGLHALLEHRLDPLLIRQHFMASALRRLQVRANARRFHLGTTEVRDLYVLPVSTLVYANFTILTFIHIPMYHADSLMELYQYQIMPLGTSNPNVHLIPRPEDSYIAVAADRSYFKAFTHNDIQRCSKIGRKYHCDNMNFLDRRLSKSCLIAIFTDSPDIMAETCVLETASVLDRAIQITHHRFLLYHHVERTIEFLCDNPHKLPLNTAPRVSFKGLKVVDVADQCRASTDSFLMSAISNLRTEEKVSVTHIKWNPDVLLRGVNMTIDNLAIALETLQATGTTEGMSINDIKLAYDIKKVRVPTIFPMLHPGFSLFGVACIGLGGLAIFLCLWRFGPKCLDRFSGNQNRPATRQSSYISAEGINELSMQPARPRIVPPPIMYPIPMAIPQTQIPAPVYVPMTSTPPSQLQNTPPANQRRNLPMSPGPTLGAIPKGNNHRRQRNGDPTSQAFAGSQNLAASMASLAANMSNASYEREQNSEMFLDEEDLYIPGYHGHGRFDRHHGLSRSDVHLPSTSFAPSTVGKMQTTSILKNPLNGMPEAMSLLTDNQTLPRSASRSNMAPVRDWLQPRALRSGPQDQEIRLALLQVHVNTLLYCRLQT